MERRNHQRRLPLLYVVLAVVLILAVVLEGCDPSLLWLVWIVAWIVYGTWFDQWVKLDRLHTYSPYETIPIRGMCRSLHDDWEVWVKVEDSEGSTVGGPWSQILHYGYNTFGWDWTAGGDEGYYTAIARLLPPGDPIGRWCATEQLVVQAGVVEYPYRLEVWCGDQTKGNPGEDLHLPFAHPIAVEVVDAGIQVPVTFRTQLGTLQSGTLVEDPPGSGNWYSQVTQESFPCLVAGNRTAQIAWASLTLSTEQQPETGDCLPHVVTASCEQARDDAYITVYSIVDGETSHLGDRTHQKGRQGQDLVEVPGDNYRVKRNQNNEQVPDPGQPGDYKDVIVELDYYLWEGATQEKIGTIAGYIEEVLETATVQADVRVGNEIPAGTGEGQMPPETDREKRMELLAYHRDHNELWEAGFMLYLGAGAMGQAGHLA